MDHIDHFSAIINAGVSGVIFIGIAVMVTAMWIFP